ncbi:hypothetical protein PENVUL_c017G06633 [Penicillium vulpinum]|uniref:Uncharacterized protein n=2 Tax=Penicillium vulpinum TaxID=29845 RepID=A0A1V6RY39_9EURO|nr:hypothetical protein PENVUL_c017G06633 [Penicillium vulpinum]
MQSPLFSQLTDEMARIHPIKWAKPIKSTKFNTPKNSQPKSTKPKNPQPENAEPTNSLKPSGHTFFASHGNRYMRHPWSVIDYHIYLTHIESRRDKIRREQECHLIKNTGFTQVAIHDKPVLDNAISQTNSTVVFVSLPIPDAQNESSTASLVLGFDLKLHRLQAYFFEPKSPIENYEDLWKVWSKGEGQLVIDIPVDRFLAAIRHTMQHQVEILEIGLLHHYGIITRAFQAGLDMVITVQFLQFVDDFAELITKDHEELREAYTPYQDELREVLAAGSRDSWFAVRDGLTIEQYRQKQLKKVVASGLFHGQKMIVLRDEPETIQKDKVSRRVKVVSGHSDRWSWSKLRVRVLVSAMFILCFCSAFDRPRVLCVGMF